MRLPLLFAVLPILASCAQKRAPSSEPPPAASPPPSAPPEAVEPETDKEKKEADEGIGSPASGGAAAERTATPPPPPKGMHRRIDGEVRLGEPKVNGVDGAAAKRALEATKDDLKKCYDKELLTNPSLAGEVDAKLSVEKDGKVNATASGIGNSALEACVAQTFETLDLGRARGQVTVRVSFSPES